MKAAYPLYDLAQSSHRCLELQIYPDISPRKLEPDASWIVLALQECYFFLSVVFMQIAKVLKRRSRGVSKRCHEEVSKCRVFISNFYVSCRHSLLVLRYACKLCQSHPRKANKAERGIVERYWPEAEALEGGLGDCPTVRLLREEGWQGDEPLL